MNEQDMHIDLNPANNGPPLHPPHLTATPEPPGTEPIVVTMNMWNHLLNRLSSLEARLGDLTDDHQTLRNRHTAFEREYYEQPLSAHKSTPPEPKIPDPPMFSGDRKELLPFITKCQLKFEGQASRFPTERSKILYAGTRLEGPAFSWFQPLIGQYPVGSLAPPPELQSFKTFTDALTVVYGDPNLEATAIREIRRLHQTGSAAEYAAKFESKKQYMHWNDQALRDQFYLNLKEELKDEIAPVGKPKTYLELKTLAIRLDARLFERRLERSNAGASTSRPPPTRPANRSFAWAAPSNTTTPSNASTAGPTPSVTPSTTPAPQSGGLRVPSHTADGTVPMELGASGLWQLTDLEKQRRRNLGLCGYCGESGHSTFRCPVAPASRYRPQPASSNRPPPRFARQAVMTFEVSSETEKDDTQE